MLFNHIYYLCLADIYDWYFYNAFGDNRIYFQSGRKRIYRITLEMESAFRSSIILRVGPNKKFWNQPLKHYINNKDYWRFLLFRIHLLFSNEINEMLKFFYILLTCITVLINYCLQINLVMYYQFVKSYINNWYMVFETSF